MATIKTCTGVSVLIDDDLFDCLSNVKLTVAGQGKYPSAVICGIRTYLHHLVVGKPLHGLWVDHRNGNVYDARRENLRIVTPRQNHYNSRPSSRNKTGVRGVYYHVAHRKWRAYILQPNGKQLSLGMFNDMESAVSARRMAEAEMHGEFGLLESRGING